MSTPDKSICPLTEGEFQEINVITEVGLTILGIIVGVGIAVGLSTKGPIWKKLGIAAIIILSGVLLIKFLTSYFDSPIRRLSRWMMNIKKSPELELEIKKKLIEQGYLALKSTSE